MQVVMTLLFSWVRCSQLGSSCPQTAIPPLMPSLKVEYFQYWFAALNAMTGEFFALMQTSVWNHETCKQIWRNLILCLLFQSISPVWSSMGTDKYCKWNFCTDTGCSRSWGSAPLSVSSPVIPPECLWAGCLGLRYVRSCHVLLCQ